MADTHTGSTHSCAFTTKISAVSPLIKNKTNKKPTPVHRGYCCQHFRQSEAPAHQMKGTIGLLNHCTELQVHHLRFKEIKADKAGRWT